MGTEQGELSGLKGTDKWPSELCSASLPSAHIWAFTCPALQHLPPPILSRVGGAPHQYITRIKILLAVGMSSLVVGTSLVEMKLGAGEIVESLPISGVSFSGEAKNSTEGLGPGMGPNVLEAMAVEAKASTGGGRSGMEPPVLEAEGVSTGVGPWTASARLCIEGLCF